MGAGGSDSRFDTARQPDRRPVQGPPHSWTQTEPNGTRVSMTRQADGLTTGVEHGYFEAAHAAEEEAWEKGAHY